MTMEETKHNAIKIHLLKSGMIYDKVTILLLVIIILMGIMVIIVKGM